MGEASSFAEFDKESQSIVIDAEAYDRDQIGHYKI